jgi:hypothetical protein
MLGKFAVESCRIDLIPSIALERLGLHNELCALKWQDDPQEWMREGFLVSTRIDSMKRHYEAIHAGDCSEDHLSHLIWGFMAISHVVAVFPHLNDLVDYENIRRHNTRTLDTTYNGVYIVGEKGFMSANKHEASIRGSNEGRRESNEEMNNNNNGENSNSNSNNTKDGEQQQRSTKSRVVKIVKGGKWGWTRNQGQDLLRKQSF